MLPASSLPANIAIRTECPPGTCVCDREQLLQHPDADVRILRLTQMEEKKLIARIEQITSYDELLRLIERIQSQLGITLNIAPGPNEVRTIRGLLIQLQEQPGLCKKIRQSIPAAIRRCLDKNPDIVYAILDAHDLFGRD
tara:strand:- start:228072 stop:228491 length:420 start_codon:yes stop_codon:yes gene_type:complete